MSQRFEKGEVLLGKLEVIRVLGEGGMGVVYEVEHRMTKHRRALKLLHPHVSANAEVTVRLLREASVAGRLRTKHVVETFDAGQLESGAAYVLMEMLEGRSLAEILEAGRLPVGRVVSIVWEACEGLAVAHQGGIVHRDLKPDNMFVAKEVDGTEIVKLLDFGISKFSERHEYEGTLTADGAVMGTPYYMSPEQTRGVVDIDGRADIYAMGVILYEGLSGRLPFMADSFPMLVVSIHEGNCPPLLEVAPGLDPALAAVVHEAMATERQDRYASVRDLQEALRPFADRALPERLGTASALVFGETMASDPGPARLSVTATPMTANDTAVRPTGPKSPLRWPLWAGAGLIVVGLVSGGIALTSGGRSSDDTDEVTDRGLAQTPSTHATTQPGLDTDAGLFVPDGGEDAGPRLGTPDPTNPTPDGERDGDAEPDSPTMDRPRGMRLGMQTMSTAEMSTTTVGMTTIDTSFDP